MHGTSSVEGWERRGRGCEGRTRLSGWLHATWYPAAASRVGPCGLSRAWCNGGMTERPRRMTIAAVVAMTTCVLLVVTLLDAMAGLRTLATVQRMRQLVDAQGWSGLSDEQLIGAERDLIFVSGALAATGAVLAFYTMRRHRGARAALSVIAALLLFSTALVATLLPVVLIAAVLTMWTGEVRDWFDGRERRPRTPAAGRPTPPPGQPPALPPGPPPGPPAGRQPWPPSAAQPSAAPPAYGPPPYAPPATSPYAQPGQAPLLDNPYSAPAVPPPPARPPRTRPVAVSVAAWLTGVFSVLTFVVLALVVTVLVAARDEALRALREQNLPARVGLSERDLLAAVWVFCAVCLFWCVAAIALAVLAYCRVNLARFALAVSAALTVVFGLMAYQAAALNAVAAAATLGLLFSPAANRWYARRDAPSGPPGGAPGAPAEDAPPEPSWSGPPAERPPGKPPVW